MLNVRYSRLTCTVLLSVGLGACSSSGSDDSENEVELKNFQNASTVIGQNNKTSGDANQSGGTAADTLSAPAGKPLLVNGYLYIADRDNNRITIHDGIPEVDGTVTFGQLGQSLPTDSSAGLGQDGLDAPRDVASVGNVLAVVDSVNNRVIIYDGIPVGATNASRVWGQASWNSAAPVCSGTGLSDPASVFIVGTKLIVADSGNNRVLIWNSVPLDATVEPDLVLGQPDLGQCQRNTDGANQVGVVANNTLFRPSGVWSDGTRLVVSDAGNNRVLIWESFPTGDQQVAQRVIGQTSFSAGDANGGSGIASASTLSNPGQVHSNNTQLCIADSDNNRVLVWNGMPTENTQVADLVLGQGDFSHKAANDDDQDNNPGTSPTARTMSAPEGCSFIGKQLLVNDQGNNRTMIFDTVKLGFTL